MIVLSSILELVDKVLFYNHYRILLHYHHRLVYQILKLVKKLLVFANVFCFIFLVDLTIPESDGSITYEQMMSYIDLILQETDYYKDSAISLSSNEFLSPTAQKNHRPPSGKK